MDYRKDIDGLRALAVLPVVFYHAGIGLVPGGFIGVDIFFVISGFLITTLLLNELHDGNFSISEFYKRRTLRIFPALSAILTLSNFET
jgi:peptidoglycan/LPS O-acetylase OafA/YrhL